MFLLHFSPQYFVFQFTFKNIRIKIYRTTVSSVVLYGCRTWAFTFRWVHILRVIEGRLLRKIFGAKWSEATGGLRNWTAWISIMFNPHHILFR
jgi:hypothetical protein